MNIMNMESTKLHGLDNIKWTISTMAATLPLSDLTNIFRLFPATRRPYPSCNLLLNISMNDNICYWWFVFQGLCYDIPKKYDFIEPVLGILII